MDIATILPGEIVNSVTGDKLKILQSFADKLAIEFTLPAQAQGAPLHYHLSFVETFEVFDGKLEMMVGGRDKKRIVAPGERIEIPNGVLHGFSNPFDAPVTFVSAQKPAADFEKFVRVMYGLANDGKTNQTGMPTNILHLVAALDFADLYFPYVPAGLQKTIRRVIRGFSQTVGAENELEKYFRAAAAEKGEPK